MLRVYRTQLLYFNNNLRLERFEDRDHDSWAAISTLFDLQRDRQTERMECFGNSGTQRDIPAHEG